MDYAIELPTFHPGQVAAFRKPGRFKAIRCGRRWGKCIARGSLIAMADGGYLPIEKIKAGDLVLSARDDGRIVSSVVDAVSSNGNKETLIIGTSGRSVTATPNHPLMVNGKWTEARFIEKGALIAVPAQLPYFGSEVRDPIELDFLAIWLAEGRDCSVSNNTPEIVDIIHRISDQWGLRPVHSGSSDWYLKHNGQHGRPISYHPVRLLLEREGLWGKDSKTKFIPGWVFRLGKTQLTRWLNLFMACDGSLSIRAKRVWALEVGLANEHMVRQLADLFLKFGIRGQIRRKIHSKLGKNGEPFESWRFIASDKSSIIAFCQEIGMLGKERRIAGALQDTMASQGTCNRYYPIEYDEIDRNYNGNRTSEFLCEMRSWRKQAQNRVTERRYKNLRDGLPEDWRIDGDLSWEEVSDIKSGPITETFDLSIAGNSNFFANNICSHNTKFGCTLAMDVAIKSYPVGWFAPEYKFLTEPYQEILTTLGDFVKSSSEQKGAIHLRSGGNIDFWTLENPLAGRGRKYKTAIIDEAAFTKNGSMLAKETGQKGIWEKNIRPTLVDLMGNAVVLSNTNGEDSENFLWQICNQPQYEFVEYHAPSSDNPYLPQSELEHLRANSHPLVWKQEYLAEFVDWSGVAFFPQHKLLYDGQPMEFPANCDAVFVVIDSATKTGKENDGTAAVYFAITNNPWTGPPLVILDWDIIQIEGASLEHWIPSVFARLDEFAIICKARRGSGGAFIEDKASGMILLQQCANRNLPAHAIDSKMTSLGKVERAFNISGYIDKDKVKLSRYAFEKVTNYKGVTRNHLLSQVVGFRMGVKDQVDDDLLDDFCYGTALALGNAEGF